MKIDAVLTAVGSGSNPDTGSFQIIAEWENTENHNILSGSSAEIIIPASVSKDKIIIPVSALTIRGDKTAVFTDKDGKALLNNVITGKRSGSRLIIKEGLSEGEILITSGLNSLGNGDKIKSFIIGNSGDSK